MPRGVSYEISNFDFPGWVPNNFVGQPLGYGYRHAGFFVHFYGNRGGTWIIHPGLTASEQADHGRTRAWVTRHFGARNVRSLEHPVGSVIDGVWRPGLYPQDQRHQALSTTQSEQRAAEASLYLLVDALQDLFMHIEPEGSGLTAYGPKTRQLLILACTEAENMWVDYMRRAKVPARGQGYTTRHYVRLQQSLHLAEYRLGLTPYPRFPKVRPFLGWSAASPTQSLGWYHAYNLTKHDRSTNLKEATLQRCIEAVAANVVLFWVRYSPFPLYDDVTPLAALVRHLFDMDMVDCDPVSFYVPLVSLSGSRRGELVCGDSSRQTLPWRIRPLQL
jgi:hypothetical protein